MNGIFLAWLVTTAMAAAPSSEPKSTPKLETATFAAGCYWGTEKYFEKLPGVVSTRVGFTGGQTPNPQYEDMHDGHTGHAESVEIQFDPKQISFEKLMEEFYRIHDPTTKDRQGNDRGTQYRSAIFYHGPKQKQEALALKARVEKSGAWKAPITTEISEAKTFWPGPPEHQKYLDNNLNGYDNHKRRDLKF